MRAAVYIRMSTERQEDSPERQRAMIDPHCERKKYRVVRRYQDHARRGYDDQRPEFQMLLTDAAKGLFDVIVVDELSRLSRSETLDYIVKVVHPLREAGVRVDSVAEGEQDWGKLAGLLVGAIHQDKAHGESASLGRRVATAYFRMAERGLIRVGPPPYGYRADKGDEGRPTLRPGPEEEVRVVRAIFEWYEREDQSLADICLRLFDRGVPTVRGGDRWTPQTVRRILTNPAYAGHYAFGRRRESRFFSVSKKGVEAVADSPSSPVSRPADEWFILPNQHPALVTTEQFDRVQGLLVQNRRRTTPVRGRGDFLFGKLLRCVGCGHFMVGLSGSRRSRAYRCAHGYNTGKCDLNIVRESTLWGQVMSALEAAFLHPGRLQQLRQRLRQKEKELRGDARRKALCQEKGRLEAKVAKARRKLSLLDEDLVGDVVADIRRWQERARLIDEELGSPPPDIDAALDDIVEELGRAMWEFRDAKERGARDVQRSLLRKHIQWIDVRVIRAPGASGPGSQYRLEGGVIYLKPGKLSALVPPGGVALPGCHLSAAGRGGGQAEATWAVSLRAEK